MKKFGFISLVLLFTGPIGLAQYGAFTRYNDVSFTQYYSSPIYLNPAFAGYDGSSRISTAYRYQGRGQSSNFQTVNGSYDRMIGKTHGVAVNYQFNFADGTAQTHALSFVYAPAIRLFKNKLVISPAIELGWRHGYLDVSKIPPYEPRMFSPWPSIYYPPSYTSTTDVFDMSAGLLLSHSNFTYGASFQHLTQPNISFVKPDEFYNGIAKLPIKYTAHLSYLGDVSERFKLSPSTIFINQQDFTELQSTLTFYVYGARIGLGFRNSFNNPDAMLFMLGYQGHGFRVAYSYDLYVSSITNNLGASHEASLAYVFNFKKSENRKGVSLINF